MALFPQHSVSAHGEVNPYAPPQAAHNFFELPPLPAQYFAEVNIRTVDIQRRFLRRRILCEGTEDAELIYDGRGFGETVHANGIFRARVLNNGLRVVAPQLDFEIEWQRHRVPARIEPSVKLNWFRGLQFRWFRLWIAERLVYDEK